MIITFVNIRIKIFSAQIKDYYFNETSANALNRDFKNQAGRRMKT